MIDFDRLVTPRQQYEFLLFMTEGGRSMGGAINFDA